ncbi:hypothetical protein BH09VER1_BH09VER1_22830 [soil metagenome]
MLNWIWLGLLLISVFLGAISGQLNEITSAGFAAAKSAVMDLALPLAGVWAIWLGIMRLAEKSNLVEILARFLRPVMRRLFPEVPPEHPAMGAMILNMASNMLGLGNSATPMGLRAMQHLESLNPRPGVATNSMCTFLAINTSSIQLIPATTVGILAAKGAMHPTSIIGTSFVATLCATGVAIITVKFLEKLPFFALPPMEGPISRQKVAEETPSNQSSPPPVTPLGAVILSAALLFFALIFVLFAFAPEAFVTLASAVRWFLATGTMFPDYSLNGHEVAHHHGALRYLFSTDWLTKHWFARAVETISLLAIPFVLTMFPLYAMARKVPVYEEFVEGAKEAFQVAIRVIPYLVAILTAIGMFRASGGIALLNSWLRPFFSILHFPPELLPLALIRPLSGSGSNGVFMDLVNTYGPDSLIAQMGGTIMGSSETTFYVLAVYFGSVAIRKTRHAVAAGLAADIAGVTASVIICNLLLAK